MFFYLDTYIDIKPCRKALIDWLIDFVKDITEFIYPIFLLEVSTPRLSSLQEITEYTDDDDDNVNEDSNDNNNKLKLLCIYINFTGLDGSLFKPRR